MLTIWLVGRTNVGKSTLFNRLLWNFRAIVTDIAWTTRELLRERVVWWEEQLELVDSPGLDDFELEKWFIQQIIDEADILLFIVDGKEELGEQELHIKEMILQAQKKERTCLVVNKLDSKVYTQEVDMLLADYYSLWWSYVVPLSAKQEQGVAELQEVLVDLIQQYKQTTLWKASDAFVDDEDDDSLHLAIVGRPNVGKSTLLNTLVGEHIAWVQDKPWTTLDYVKASFLYKNTPITLYDTAGIRKKWKTVGLEKIAYTKTQKMISWVKPVVVMLLDLHEWLTHRDKTLIGEMVALGIPLVIAVNKIDIFDPQEADMYIQDLRRRLGFAWIPVVKISWKEWIALPALIDTVCKVSRNYHTRIHTWILNKSFKKAWITSPPRFPKNKICKCKYISQVETAPPVFMLSVNNNAYANFSYRAWVEKVLRKQADFTGVPIQLRFNSKVASNPYLEHEN